MKLIPECKEKKQFSSVKSHRIHQIYFNISPILTSSWLTLHQICPFVDFWPQFPFKELFFIEFLTFKFWCSFCVEFLCVDQYCVFLVFCLFSNEGE